MNKNTVEGGAAQPFPLAGFDDASRGNVLVLGRAGSGKTAININAFCAALAVANEKMNKKQWGNAHE